MQNSRQKMGAARSIIKEHRKKVGHKVWLVFCILVFLWAGLGWLSNLNSLQINELSFQGNTIVDEENLESFTWDFFDNNLFFIYSSSNKFLVAKDTLREELGLEYPRLKSIQVSAEGNNLSISMEERRGSFAFCNFLNYDLTSTQSSEECYLMDYTGFIFDTAFEFSGSLFFKIVTFVEEEPLGSYAFEDEFYFLDLRDFIENLKNRDFDLVAVDIRDKDKYVLHIRNEFDPSSVNQIFFTHDQDFASLLNSFETTIKSEIFGDSLPVNLDYIDLRFGNKVYYRFYE